MNIPFYIRGTCYTFLNMVGILQKEVNLMKTRFATVLAATAVLGVTTAFAANPFSDVTLDS